MLARSSSSSSSVWRARSAGRASCGAAPALICSHRLRLTAGVSVSSNRCVPPAGRLARAAVAQRQVELGVVEVLERVVRRDADVDVGMAALERLDPRQQPERAERREGGDADALPAARAADALDADVELGEQRLDRAQQRLPVGGDLDVARAANEQLRPELVLETLDLAADGRLGDVQLVGGGAEAERPRDRFEGAQVGQRERSAGSGTHANRASISARRFHWIYL